LFAKQRCEQAERAMANTLAESSATTARNQQLERVLFAIASEVGQLRSAIEMAANALARDKSGPSVAETLHGALEGVAGRGTLFIGYVEAGLGLGESLRGLLASVAGTALPFSVYPFNVNVETRHIGPFMADRYDFSARYDVNLFEMAVDQLP